MMLVLFRNTGQCPVPPKVPAEKPPAGTVPAAVRPGPTPAEIDSMIAQSALKLEKTMTLLDISEKEGLPLDALIKFLDIPDTLAARKPLGELIAAGGVDAAAIDRAVTACRQAREEKRKARQASAKKRPGPKPWHGAGKLKKSMTLAEAAQHFNMPLEYLKMHLRVATLTSKRATLGDLCEKYDFTLADVEKVVRDYEEEGRTGAVPCSFVPTADGPEAFQDCVSPGNPATITPAVLKKMAFDSNGKAFVYADSGWMLVSRTGEVLLTRIATLDNGPDELRNGLMRFTEKGKWGYADIHGRKVIPARFDGAMPFHNGAALVCQGCKNECADEACEHRAFKGGRHFRIDTLGRVLK